MSAYSPIFRSALCQCTHLIRQNPAPVPQQQAAAAAAAATGRFFHAAPARYAYKDSQDRQSLKPSGTEGSKSSRDGDAAQETDAAFNPSKTDPAKEKETAAKGSQGNPLEFSGANQELSKPQGDHAAASQGSASKEMDKSGKASGGGSPPKKGKP